MAAAEVVAVAVALTEEATINPATKTCQ